MAELLCRGGGAGGEPRLPLATIPAFAGGLETSGCVAVLGGAEPGLVPEPVPGMEQGGAQPWCHTALPDPT